MGPSTRVHLPSGRVVALEPRAGLERRERRRHGPLFSEMVELVTSGDLVVAEGNQHVDAGSLDLADFHALRAIAMRLGWLEEQPIEVVCHNCGEIVRHTPCAALELGPFLDGELDDPDLDRTLDLSAPHPIPPVSLGEGGVAHDARLTRVTVAAAAPLHRALRRRRLASTERVIQAMGLASLGPEQDPARIAAALAGATGEARARLGELFLRAHYPARLCSIVFCAKCGARSDIDAPYEREFEPPPSPTFDSRAKEAAQPLSPSNAQLFPDFDTFDAHAREVFGHIAPSDLTREGSSEARDRTDPLVEGSGLVFVVDDGIPACDDGGEPLLGAYIPPGGEPSAPVGLGEVTVYYRSFRAAWEDDGPYDWQAELEATIEHELEHHAGWRTGHDATDDDERAEIARERALRVGRRATVRSSFAGFAADLSDFIARTWPIWLIVAAWALAMSVCGK